MLRKEKDIGMLILYLSSLSVLKMKACQNVSKMYEPRYFYVPWLIPAFRFSGFHLLYNDLDLHADLP